MAGFFPKALLSTKTVVSGISYEKSVQEKDPGNHENGGYGALEYGRAKMNGDEQDKSRRNSK